MVAAVGDTILLSSKYTLCQNYFRCNFGHRRKKETIIFKNTSKPVYKFFEEGEWLQNSSLESTGDCIKHNHSSKGRLVIICCLFTES